MKALTFLCSSNFKLLWGIILLLFVTVVYPQEKSPIYFDINISNNVNSISTSALKNVTARLIEKNMPNNFVRSYDDRTTVQCKFSIILISSDNRYGETIGVVFAVYGSIRTYPATFIALMPENLRVGITPEIYDTNFIEAAINAIAGGIFGQLDTIRELLETLSNENRYR